MTLPLLLSLADELETLSTRSYADDFGFGLYPHRHYHAYGPRNHGWLQRHHKMDSDRPLTKVEKDGFQVTMDVQQFKPEELTVKVVGDFIVVEGQHEEREDEHGFISRHFVRRYALPKGYDSEQIASTLSSDGILAIKVLPATSESSKERVIEIQQTGVSHFGIKDNDSVEDEQNDASE